MGLLLKLCCYLAVIAAAVGGAAGVLIGSAPELSAISGPAAGPLRPPVVNRITAWQERKAEEQAYAARAASAAIQPVALTASRPEVQVVREAPSEEKPVAEVARPRPKVQRTAKRSRPDDSRTALGYAAAPRSRIAYENLFNAMRDRAGN
jgi:hypothetical protein